MAATSWAYGRRRRSSAAQVFIARREPVRRDQGSLKLGDQLAGGVGEARGGGRPAERVELGGFERRVPSNAIALELRDAAGAVTGSGRDLGGETAEGEDRPEHRARFGELPGEVVGVNGGRDDQDRAAVRGGGERAQHLAGLGGVRGSEYEREGHVPHGGARPRRGDFQRSARG